MNVFGSRTDVAGVRAAGVPASGVRVAGVRVAGVAAALALGVTLGGCGAVQAGSAATVGDTAISQTDLEDRTTAFLDSLPAEQRTQANGQISTVETAVLNELVLERLVGTAAQKAGVTVSDAEVAAQVTQATTQAGAQLDTQLAQSYLTRDRLPDLLRVNLEVYAIGRVGAPAGTTAEQAAQRAIAYITAPDRGIPVRINPRFGTWEGVQIKPGSGSLSSLAANSPSPSASAAPSPAAGS